MSTAYICIGSNLGDRLGYVREAIRRIEQSKEIKISKTSSVYETQPTEYKDQPWFLNIVLELNTMLEPLNLLELLLNIENQMGRTRPEGSSRRKRNQKYGARNIDLDLLLYDDLVLNSDRLTLPHPRMHERKFVLVPLAEIAPKVIHPLKKKSIEELLEELSTHSTSEKDKFGVRLYSEKIF